MENRPIDSDDAKARFVDSLTEYELSQVAERLAALSNGLSSQSTSRKLFSLRRNLREFFSNKSILPDSEIPSHEFSLHGLIDRIQQGQFQVLSLDCDRGDLLTTYRSHLTFQVGDSVCKLIISKPNSYRQDNDKPSASLSICEQEVSLGNHSELVELIYDAELDFLLHDSDVTLRKSPVSLEVPELDSFMSLLLDPSIAIGHAILDGNINELHSLLDKYHKDPSLDINQVKRNRVDTYETVNSYIQAVSSSTFYRTADVIRILSEYGADINATGEPGTPLRYSILGARSPLRVVETLLDCGADPLTVEHDGITTFSAIQSSGNANPEIIALLESRILSKQKKHTPLGSSFGL